MKRHSGAIKINGEGDGRPTAAFKAFLVSAMLIFSSLFFAAENCWAENPTGLWVGQIEIDQVNEVGHPTDTTTPTDVEHPFDMRILLHVEDADGNKVPEVVRLLKKVTVMGKRYTVNNPDGTVEERIQRVLITDDTLLENYEGVIRRDGKLVGIRLGSAGFQFDPAKNELDLTGSMGLGQTLGGVITLSKDHPINPFKHKYHPDHREGFDITRTITMTFDSETDPNDPESGVDKYTGEYAETMEGLHKIPLNVKGTFSLDRVSLVPTLNDN